MRQDLELNIKDFKNHNTASQIYFHMFFSDG